VLPIKVQLLLRAALVKDALSSMLAAAGFCVLRERDHHDDHITMIIDIDDCKEPEVVGVRQGNGNRVVVLASEADPPDIDNEQVALLSGILTYDLSADAFVRSLRLICAGERIFPRDLAPGRRLPAPSLCSEARSDGNRLSPREREVLAHLLEGHANKVIAWHLGMSTATVKVHLKNVLRKIKVDNRTQAAIWAMHNLSEFTPAARGLV
jgi:two-component system, NarL family, nitrate/nitrite response regulator NarL